METFFHSIRQLPTLSVRALIWQIISLFHGDSIKLCLEPSDYFDHGQKMSERASGKMSLVVEYEQPDAFAGHLQYFQGLTLFYASAKEMTLGMIRWEIFV